MIPTSVPVATIPTPAAAPPAVASLSLVRKGRLKALNTDGSLCGYIIGSPISDGSYRRFSTDPDDALLVSFSASPLGESFEIQIIDTFELGRVIDVLAFFWHGLSGEEWLNDYRSIAGFCAFSNLKSKTPYAAERKVWTISKDGELTGEYPKADGGAERLQPYRTRLDRVIYWLRPSTPDTYGWGPVRIVIEDFI